MEERGEGEWEFDKTLFISAKAVMSNNATMLLGIHMASYADEVH